MTTEQSLQSSCSVCLICITHESQAAAPEHQRGLKLDFKDPAVVPKCLETLNRYQTEDLGPRLASLTLPSSTVSDEITFNNTDNLSSALCLVFRFTGAVWLNADIWQGPGGGEPHFSATAFLNDCTKACKSSAWALSVGWTTSWRLNTDAFDGYTKAHVDGALASLAEAKTSSCMITFPISAYHAYLGRRAINR